MVKYKNSISKYIRATMASNKKHNYKLVIRYIGTKYHGWQKQPKHKTVQGVIEEKLEILFKERITLIGSGRTDAGVHALGQVANFKTVAYKKPEDIYRYLNATLPRDISIKSVEEVPLSFHARFSAKGKTYIYRIYTKPDPFLYGFGWYISKHLDIRKMVEALNIVKKSKNLISLSKKGENLREDVEIRELYLRYDGEIIEIEITASHFLRYMVRKIVGHIVQIGLGSLSIREFENIIESKDPSKGLFIAPPEGLFLKEVYY
ncbi:tRNA pseudouridine(38-40) synthase TruA [Persephonella sp.]